MNWPPIIQAGMGVGVSNWVLANAVARTGNLGVVSGTALDTVLVRRLQCGDPGGHIARALSHFPLPAAADRLFKKYFVPSGKRADSAFQRAPMMQVCLTSFQQELLMAANFVEVFLAKENHSGPVGINYLEKIQLPLLPSLYGAMLAGVDYVLMGAGIPRELPSLLNRLARHEDVEYKLAVHGGDDTVCSEFSPAAHHKPSTALKRPKFLAIISSTVLGIMLAKKVTPPVDGLVIEDPSAGGHNAPPRQKASFNDRGEPVYGPKDKVDLEVIRELNLPFWLAGSRASPEGFRDALGKGACGVQVGTAFALCSESGLDSGLRTQILRKIVDGDVDVFTDALASPTGFPFKVVRIENTNSESFHYKRRTRRCDLGYLRQIYQTPGGAIGYRCPGEPVATYVRKGGQQDETVGRKCLCNGLLANIGLGQRQPDGATEKPLITMGDDIKCVRRFFKNNEPVYSAKDVIDGLTEMST